VVVLPSLIFEVGFSFLFVKDVGEITQGRCNIFTLVLPSVFSVGFNLGFCMVQDVGEIYRRGDI